MIFIKYSLEEGTIINAGSVKKWKRQVRGE
jgi:hypothetical protein